MHSCVPLFFLLCAHSTYLNYFQMYTAIFPYSYRYYHTRDSSLGTVFCSSFPSHTLYFFADCWLISIDWLIQSLFSNSNALNTHLRSSKIVHSCVHSHSFSLLTGPKGDLRVYLEKLAMADNIQEFVSSNPFGQRPIREANPSWGYYLKVIESLKCMENDRPSSSSDREKTA